MAGAGAGAVVAAGTRTGARAAAEEGLFSAAWAYVKAGRRPVTDFRDEGMLSVCRMRWDEMERHK